MSKVTQGLSMTMGTDAAFRAWGSLYSATLLAAGLTQTSDTGQINWTTVVRATANTDAGYEIWRWNDTAQSTRPIFLKVRYGTSAATDRPRVLVDVGEGSNGSGTLTGAVQVGIQLGDWANTGTGTVDLNVNYNTTLGFLGITFTNLVGVGSNFLAQTLTIERLKDATGAPTTRGASVVWCYAGSILKHSVFASAWTTEPAASIPAYWPIAQAGMSSAGGTFIAGLTPNTGNGTHGVLERTLAFCVCGFSDFNSGEVFSTTRWDGNSHSYLALVTYGAANQTSNFPGQYARHAMLWE